MIAGMQVYNDQGIELINTNDPMVVVYNVLYNVDASNFNTGFYIPYTGWPEAPSVFIRPRAGYYYGTYRVQRSGDGLLLFLSQDLPGYSGFNYCDVAVGATATSLGIQTGGTFGLETYNQEGNLIFSSAFKYARVRQISRVPGVNLSVANSSSSAAITAGFSKMPWVVARDAGTSVQFNAGGESISSEVGFFFSINAQFTQITVRGSDTTSNSNNQYWGRFMSFPLCEIPGIP